MSLPVVDDAFSNANAFALAEVSKAGRMMLGVVAKHAISGTPVNIGVYPGRLINTLQSALKREQYALRYGVTRKLDLQRATAYNRDADELAFDHELDPSDADGNILPEFAGHLALYINEPAPDQPLNATFVYDHPNQRYEAWLILPVAAGEEITVSYGRHYWREYPVNAAACAKARLKHIY